MKIYLLVFGLFLQLVWAKAAVADAASDQDKLIGAWRYLEQGEAYQTTLTFNADGKFSIFVRLAQGGTISISGRWSYQDGKISYLYERSSPPIPETSPGKRGLDVVEEVTDTKLILLQGPRRERAMYRKLS